MPFRANPITQFAGRQTSRPRYLPRAEAVLSREAEHPGAESAVSALAAAVQLRRAVHSGIVDAFRRQVEGTGDGPNDAQLRLFARIAVVEVGLKRALGTAEGHLSPIVQQGEVQ